jgi:hypothetical protein
MGQVNERLDISEAQTRQLAKYLDSAQNPFAEVNLRYRPVYKNEEAQYSAATVTRLPI